MNNSKISNIIRVISFALILITVPVIFLCTPKKSVSEDENRVLANLPKLNFDSYVSRDFMNSASDYISDHFPLRTDLISLKNNAEKIVLKNEINGVLNIDGQLVQIFRNPDSRIMQNNCSSIEKYAKKHDTVFALAPTVQNYIADSLPFYAYQTDESEYIKKCYSITKSAMTVDLSKALGRTSGEYLYYRTDHHWTANGAYNAYSALGYELGYAPHDKTEYEITTMSDSFLGTLYSKTLEKDLTPDSILQYKLKSKINAQIYDNSGKLINKSLYYKESLYSKDKYSYYLGGNKGVINIKSTAKSGKKLLVIKDSYFNSLSPFLSDEFDEIKVVDLRYATIDELKTVNADEYDKTLILYNVIGFCDEKTVKKIKYIN